MHKIAHGRGERSLQRCDVSGRGGQETLWTRGSLVVIPRSAIPHPTRPARSRMPSRLPMPRSIRRPRCPRCDSGIDTSSVMFFTARRRSSSTRGAPFRLRRYSELLIGGSQVRALVRPPSSPPKLAVEDLPAERPIFGRCFAIVRAALASLRTGLVS